MNRFKTIVEIESQKEYYQKLHQVIEKEYEIKQTNEKITPVKTVQKQNVQTGDESNGALWLTFMGLSLLLIFLTLMM